MELNMTCDSCDARAVTRYAGLRIIYRQVPGAYAPGFMLTCAPRTLKLYNDFSRDRFQDGVLAFAYLGT